MVLFRISLRRLLCAVLLCLLCALSLMNGASAEPYGRGGYSGCGYQKCPKPALTRAVTPAGLEVSINLTNGQSIPYTGYTIVVSPLNGQGSSFANAAFYVNNDLLYTGKPDETGTVRWSWKPGALQIARLKVGITDRDGQQLIREFSVTIEHPAIATQSPPAAKPSGLSGAVQRAYENAKQALETLPPPVVYSFPYLLFVLLGINVLLLLLQAKRELSEYHTTQVLLDRARAMDEAKRTLTQLVSHYLRTPLTVMAGGAELLAKESGSRQQAGTLQEAIGKLQAKVDTLITRTETAPQVTHIGDMPAFRASGLWRQPGLYVPLVLIAIIIPPFNLLANNADNLSINQLNLLLQVVIFTLLLLVTYQVFRRLQLRKRDARHLRQQAEAEAVGSRDRDQFVASTVVTLNDDLQAIDTLAAKLPAGQAAAFVRTGQGRFHSVLAKFTIASHLRGGHASEPFIPTTLQHIITGIPDTIFAVAKTRGINIKAKDTALTIQQPELIATVLASLLDNAIAYSPDNATVAVTARVTEDTQVITVMDHGCGIASDKLPLLFQPFSKAEGALTFTHEGMGFSLYLDKLIMTYLGGDILLDSHPDKGTIVSLHLPAGPV